MPRQQINVRLPADLAIAVRNQPQSVTELVEQGLRWRLGMPAANGAPVAEQADQLLGDLEDRIADHERRLQRIEEAANL